MAKMVGIEVKARADQGRTRSRSVMTGSLRNNTFTPPQKNSEIDQEGASLFVLTRLPTATRSSSAKTDDSPSSVLVDPPTKPKRFSLDHHIPNNNHNEWKQHGMNGDATAFTATTAATSGSGQSSSQRTISTKSLETVYSKPEVEFTVQDDHSSQQGSLLHPNLQRSLHTNNSRISGPLQFRAADEEHHHDDDDSSSCSSAALDAFLDSRLQSLLEDTTTHSFGPQNTDLGGGTADNPVDLTNYRVRDEMADYPPGDPAFLDSHLEPVSRRATTPPRPAAVPHQLHTPVTPSRRPSPFSAHNKTSRPRFSNTTTPPPAPHHHTDSSRPKVRTPPPSERHVPLRAKKTVTTPPRQKGTSPKPYSTPQRPSRQHALSQSARAISDPVSVTPLHHPYSRPSLLRTPQRALEVLNMSNRGLSSQEFSPVENTRTQRSSSYFNPLQGLSPGRHFARRGAQFMGIFNRGGRMNEQDYDDDDDDDDASSVDSETFLELWASQIRAELRQEAMVELALEAERAAESGQERFSSTRPWTYSSRAGEEAGHSKYSPQSSPQHLMIRRNASYTEGVTPASRRATISSTSLLSLRPRVHPKIPVKDLRDVNEVFPDFDRFHKNLRTHLVRNNVDEACLIFEEVKTEAADAENLTLEECLSISEEPDSSTNTSNQNNKDASAASFLDSFSFDLLGGAAAAGMVVKCPTNKQDQDANGGEAGIGDILADHLQSSRKPPKRETLPGMEDLNLDSVVPMSAHAVRRRNFAKNRDEVITPRPQASASQQEETGSVQPPNHDEKVSPRALFDDTVSFDFNESSILEGVSSSVENSSMIPSANGPRTPLTSSFNTSSSSNNGIFVTPAKLRKIRGNDGLPLAKENSGGHIPLPSLETSQSDKKDSHPQQRYSSPLEPRPSSPTTSDGTPPALLLPSLPTENHDSSADHPPSRAASLRPLVTSKQPNDRLSIDQGSRAQAGEAGASVISSMDLGRNKNGRKQARRWRHKILKNSLAAQEELMPILSEAIRSTPLKEDEKEEKEENPDPEPNSTQNEAVTPAMQDCTCLSLSPTPSLEEFAFPDADGSGDIRADEEGGEEPFTAAMKMFSNLSPRQKQPSASKTKKRQKLYVGLQENDDFMKNFLYCGKRIVNQPGAATIAAAHPNPRVCAEPCHDDRCDDGVAAFTNTCYATFVLDDPEETPNTATCAPVSSVTTRDSLFRQGDSHHKVEPETWFDVATEQVDGVIESLVGATPSQNRWNLSFEPPSLRKYEPASGGSNFHRKWTGLDTTAEEKTLDGASLSPAGTNSSVNSTTSASPQPSTPVVTLFNAKSNELTDSQFQLVYGMNREEHQQHRHRGHARTGSLGSRKHRPQNSLIAGEHGLDISNKSY